MVVAPPQLIAGRYRPEEEIGRGGMAVVYRAHDRKLGRDVAIKLVDPGPRPDSGFAAAVIREARAAALPHPNVAAVFDAGQHDGRPYIVMELVEGGDLGALRADGPVDPLEAARIGQGVARGLAAMHARGMVHCDVKPQNILLTRDRRPKLVDFGIARLASTSMTAERGEIVGSIPYLAPEQVRGDPVDARTDVYALGIVLYELLAGEPPFVGGTLAEIAMQRLHRSPRPIREAAPDTPRALARVVDRALALDPADRFPDAGAMAAGLAGVGGSERGSVGGGWGRLKSALGGWVTDHPLKRVAWGFITDRPLKRVVQVSVKSHCHALSLSRSLALGAPRALYLLAGLACLLLLAVGTVRLAATGRADETAHEAVAVADAGAPARMAATGVRAAEATRAPTSRPAAAPTVSAPTAVPTVAVPRVAVPPVGALGVDEAVRQLRAAGLEPEIVEEVALDTPAGIVVSHDPEAGGMVEPGGPVRLLVSRGVELPDLRGQQWDEVKPWLDEHGWPLARVRFVVAGVEEWGTVLAQSPTPEDGPAADKASAGLSLEIAGPPEATRSGYPVLGGPPAPAPPAREQPAPPAPSEGRAAAPGPAEARAAAPPETPSGPAPVRQLAPEPVAPAPPLPPPAPPARPAPPHVPPGRAADRQEEKPHGHGAGKPDNKPDKPDKPEKKPR